VDRLAIAGGKVKNTILIKVDQDATCRTNIPGGGERSTKETVDVVEYFRVIGEGERGYLQREREKVGG